MRDRLRHLSLLLAWMLPASPGKNALLRGLGHPIDSSAIARASLVWRVDRISLSPGARLGRWNVVKNMTEVVVGEDATIGRLNVISSHPVFARLMPTGARLSVAAHAKITSRHQLDCSGGVELGEFASLAGHQTRIMSHSVDLARNAQAARPVVIGARSFVGTRCLILGGSRLPDRSVLAAGSVLTRASEERGAGLWAGVPARLRGAVAGAWFDRTETSTRDVWLPETDEIVRDAL